jgi:hypothetical protein
MQLIADHTVFSSVGDRKKPLNIILLLQFLGSIHTVPIDILHYFNDGAYICHHSAFYELGFSVILLLSRFAFRFIAKTVIS